MYATAYTCDRKEPLEQLVSVDGTKNVTKIYVLGIPDGVSPYVNETLIIGDETLRLYIFSDKPLSEKLIKLIELHHKGEKYDVLTLTTASAQVVQPLRSFYVHDERCAKDYTSYTEYRYFRQRFTPANVIYNPNSGNVYRFVLPEECRAPIAFIMPANYIAISPKHGYIIFEKDLIIHMFTKHSMISEKQSPATDSRTTASFVVNNTQIMRTENMLNFVKDKFSKMGFLNTYTVSARQLVAYDDFITAVFGDYSNINI